MMYERMLKEQRKLEDEIQSIQMKLKELPNGRIFCTQNEQRYKWYYSDGHSQTYLPKKERPLAEQLAAKKYLNALYQDLLAEKKAVDAYLKNYNSKPRKSDTLLTKKSGYQELLSPYFQPSSKELIDWAASPYEMNTKYPEQLTHKTSSNHYVRSKSEVLIDTFLHIHKLPFRYECALHLGEVTVFPDFTIMHPATKQIYYWEHFGLMDDPAYARNTYSKLQYYISYGIIPTIQLITTFENKDHPLSSDTIETIINHYFL